MALKKSLSNEKGETIHIEMGTLEQAHIYAQWSLGEHSHKKPTTLSTDEKIDLLAVGNHKAIKRASDSYKIDLENWQKKYDELHDDFQVKYKAFNDMIETLPEGTHTC